MASQQASILAIDFGEKRVGLSIASWSSRLAGPLTTLANDSGLIDNIVELSLVHQVTDIVVGYPRNLSGGETQQTAAVTEFVKSLQGRVSLPISLQDESLTSVQAKAELEARGKPYNKAEVDALAATYILTDWLVDHGKMD